MAKLRSYYNLCSISDQKDFLGLSQDVDPVSIINTIGRNLFYTVQLNNQQQANSWSVLDKLTNKVVYNFKANKYVGVFANRYIRCWDADTKDINKIKKIKLSKNVADLVSRENRDVIIVYTDGTCESLEESFQPPIVESIKLIVDSSSEKIFNITSLTINDEEFLSYFVKSNTHVVSLVFMKLNGDTFRIVGQPNKLPIARREHVNLVGYTIVENDLFPNLITIWSDKRIFMLPLKNDASTLQDIPGYFVSMLNALKVDQPLVILGISKDCVAIYGPNQQQDGASLILYNTQFSVIQSKQYFKVYFDDLQLWVMKRHILLSFAQNLACVSFSISKEQLSDMIGSQYNPLHADIVDKDCINEENDLDEMIEFDVEGQRLEAARPPTRDAHTTNEERDRSYVQDVLPSKALETLEQINKTLYELYDSDVAIDIVRSTNVAKDTVQLKLCNNVNATLFSSDEVQLFTSILERNGASEYEISDHLIPILIAAKRSDELVTCLRSYTNISDRRLSETLKYFISLNSNDANPSNDETLKLINVVLSCTFNETAIKEYLRIDLTFDNVIFILNYIYDLLAGDEIALEEVPQMGDEFNDDEKLLEWFSTILDAHFQQFILSKNAKLPTMIDKWKLLIDGHMSVLREAINVSAILYNLVRGKHNVLDRPTSKWYSIESVKLY